MKNCNICSKLLTKCSNGVWFGRSDAQLTSTEEKNSIFSSDSSLLRKRWKFCLTKIQFMTSNIEKKTNNGFYGVKLSKNLRLIKNFLTIKLPFPLRTPFVTCILPNFYSLKTIMFWLLVQQVQVNLLIVHNFFQLALMTPINTFLLLFQHKQELIKPRTPSTVKCKSEEKATMVLRLVKNASFSSMTSTCPRKKLMVHNHLFSSFVNMSTTRDGMIEKLYYSWDSKTSSYFARWAHLEEEELLSQIVLSGISTCSLIQTYQVTSSIAFSLPCWPSISENSLNL